MKSKIITFASQRIIELKQFLTRPNLACSVAKNDRRSFCGFESELQQNVLLSISKRKNTTSPQSLI